MKEINTYGSKRKRVLRPSFVSDLVNGSTEKRQKRDPAFENSDNTELSDNEFSGTTVSTGQSKTALVLQKEEPKLTIKSVKAREPEIVETEKISKPALTPSYSKELEAFRFLEDITDQTCAQPKKIVFNDDQLLITSEDEQQQGYYESSEEGNEMAFSQTLDEKLYDVESEDEPIVKPSGKISSIEAIKTASVTASPSASVSASISEQTTSSKTYGALRSFLLGDDDSDEGDREDIGHSAAQFSSKNFSKMANSISTKSATRKQHAEHKYKEELEFICTGLDGADHINVTRTSMMEICVKLIDDADFKNYLKENEFPSSFYNATLSSDLLTSFCFMFIVNEQMYEKKHSTAMTQSKKTCLSNCLKAIGSTKCLNISELDTIDPPFSKISKILFKEFVSKISKETSNLESFIHKSLQWIGESVLKYDQTVLESILDLTITRDIDSGLIMFWLTFFEHIDQNNCDMLESRSGKFSGVIEKVINSISKNNSDTMKLVVLMSSQFDKLQEHLSASIYINYSELIYSPLCLNKVICSISESVTLDNTVLYSFGYLLNVVDDDNSRIISDNNVELLQIIFRDLSVRADQTIVTQHCRGYCAIVLGLLSEKYPIILECKREIVMSLNDFIKVIANENGLGHIEQKVLGLIEQLT